MKRQIRVSGMILLTLAVAVFGCSGGGSHGGGSSALGSADIIYTDLKIDDLGFTIDDYPDVDGSTSAHPLAVLIACKVLGISYSWESWGIDEGTDLYPVEEAGKEDIADYISRDVIHNGTHSAYVNLIDGAADLILVARLPSDDELGLARNRNVRVAPEPVALDAFCFILNIRNPVQSLTIEEIRGIYTGEITYWSEVGGLNQPISPYRRNKNSGSQELMETLVMKDLQMMELPNVVLPSMSGPFLALSGDQNGICYTVYFYKEFMAPRGGVIKFCGIDGVFPNYQNISSGKYALTTEVYVVIREDLDTESTAYQLRDWLLGADGQRVVKESGYVPFG